MKKIAILFAAIVFAVGCGNGYDSVDAQEFSEALKNPDVQIIDTRTPQEFSEGHIPGAVNIDLDGGGTSSSRWTALTKTSLLQSIAEAAEEARLQQKGSSGKDSK